MRNSAITFVDRLQLRAELKGRGRHLELARRFCTSNQRKVKSKTVEATVRVGARDRSEHIRNQEL